MHAYADFESGKEQREPRCWLSSRTLPTCRVIARTEGPTGAQIPLTFRLRGALNDSVSHNSKRFGKVRVLSYLFGRL